MKKGLVGIISFVVVMVICLSACGAAKQQGSTATANYNDAASFETAINNGEEPVGAVVTFVIDKIAPDSALGYNLQAGEHLNFIPAESVSVAEGDSITVKVTSTERVLGSWILYCTTTGLENVQPAETEPAEAPAAISFGSTIQFNDFEITFGSEYWFAAINNEWSDYHGREVFAVPVHLQNNGDESTSFPIIFLTYYGPDGVSMDLVNGYFEDSIDWSGQMRSGASTDTVLYFLYEGDGTYYLEFDNLLEKVEAEFEIVKQ